MSLPSVEDVVNMYLYGQTTTPVDLTDPSLIRSSFLSPPPSITVDAQEFMTTGAGRFAVGAQFELIGDFFNEDPGGIGALTTGTYTKAQIASHFGLSSYGWSTQQYDWQDSVDDYAARTFVYGSCGFKIDDNAEFVVHSDGSRTIENYSIIPDPAANENFDFSSDNGITAAADTVLQPILDPSPIGHTIDINFPDYA